VVDFAPQYVGSRTDWSQVGASGASTVESIKKDSFPGMRDCDRLGAIAATAYQDTGSSRRVQPMPARSANGLNLRRVSVRKTSQHREYNCFQSASLGLYFCLLNQRFGFNPRRSGSPFNSARGCSTGESNEKDFDRRCFARRDFYLGLSCRRNVLASKVFD
jgi:hypothetical protein